MMPAKSTSDQRTYSSMTNGCGERSGGPSPGEARTLGGGAKAVHPVGFEASPQRRATDAEPPRGFRELAARVLQRVGNRRALPFGERECTSRWKDRCLSEILRAVLEGREPCAEILQSIAHIAVPLAVDHTPGRRVGIQQAALLIEDDDAFIDRIDDGAHEWGKRGGRVTRRADRLVDHCLVILIQILQLQGSCGRDRLLDSCQDETRSWGKRLLLCFGLRPPY